MTTGLMICGHGSRDRAAVAEFEAFAGRVRGRTGNMPVAHGFLEFATPVIRDGLDALAGRGVTEILAVPGMLFAAGHAKNDIPSVLNRWAAGTDGVAVRYGRELAVDSRMLRAAGSRIEEGLAAAGGDMPTSDTLLLVVGRGSSDPDANGNVAKIMRLLWEGFGFGWGETAYSGVTFPLTGPALDHAARLGYRRVLVFPYFLFTGVLVRRIYDEADAAAARYPEIEFVKIPYLRDHPGVVDTVMERISEIRDGTGNMNCQLCKYREAMLGFEDEVGLVQRSHHDHAEGGAHGHAHGHHHPYPHAGHPLGPASLKSGAPRGR